ncbi:MAG: alpha-1,2-fucosyltransferase [Acidobacteriota bacterium]
MTAYSYAKLSERDLGLLRIGGTGLGNLLLTWAEFAVGTGKYGLTPIAPTWPQVKLGPLARHESDKRTYRDLFLKNSSEVSGIRKLKLLATLPRIPAADFTNGSGSQPVANGREVLVEFDNAGALFERILSDHEFVRRELLRITRAKHKLGLEHNFTQSISVHVRLGDFRVESLVTPISWFEGAIRAVRRAVGSDLPVYVFSDGEDAELQPILRLPGTKRLGFGSSIADILALSAANILIAAGGSTFSRWASYLGRMPVIYPPGTLYQKLYPENPAAEIEWRAGESLPPAFVEQLQRSLVAA